MTKDQLMSRCLRYKKGVRNAKILKYLLADQEVLPKSGASTSVSPPVHRGLTFELQKEFILIQRETDLEKIRLE